MEPRLRSSIETILSACENVFGKDLRCVILKGSIIKGDFIPDYSDVDIHVYVEPNALEGEKSPRLDLALEFQEKIGQLDPGEAGVSSFQLYFLSAEKSLDEWGPPIPGTYKILYGAPVPAMRMIPLHEYLEHEWSHLEQVRRTRLGLLGKFVDKPNHSIPSVVRLTGAWLKDCLYSLSCVLTRDPEKTFSSPLDQILNDTCDKVQELSHAKNFFDAVRNWTEVEKNPTKAREVFALGIKALEAIERWRASTAKPF